MSRIITISRISKSIRSAGACPPRSFDPRENRTQTKAVFPIEAWRGTGPRPTVSGTLFFTVARGPVPRDLSICAKNARKPTVSLPIEAWRGTGPRPTVKGGGLAYRSAGALGCHTRIRAGFPRERSTYAKTERRSRPFPVPIEAWRGTGPRPTVNGDDSAYRSAGACPPRAHL